MLFSYIGDTSWLYIYEKDFIVMKELGLGVLVIEIILVFAWVVIMRYYCISVGFYDNHDLFCYSRRCRQIAVRNLYW